VPKWRCAEYRNGGVPSAEMDGGEAKMEVCGVEEYCDGRSVRPRSVLSGEVVRSRAVLSLTAERASLYWLCCE